MSTLALGHTEPRHLTHQASEDPCTHSGRGLRCGDVCVSTCFGDHSMGHQHWNGWHVLQVMPFKGLPLPTIAFGSERRRQPVHIDDKTDIRSLLSRLETSRGHRWARRWEIHPIDPTLLPHVHQLPTQPTDQGPTNLMSKFAIRELGQMVQDRSH